MKIFLDTAEIEEIRIAARWGVLDGVTNNPSLFARTSGKTYDEVLVEICGITSGPVSAEVVADDVEGMLREGRQFAKLAPNIVVKVPMSEEGLEAEVLAASIRHPRHMTEAALLGAHIATTPFKVLQQMVHHPLTDKGIKAFHDDWEKARQAAAELAGKAGSGASRHN